MLDLVIGEFLDHNQHVLSHLLPRASAGFRIFGVGEELAFRRCVSRLQVFRQ